MVSFTPHLVGRRSALSQRASTRYIAFTLLYFSQGLPQGVALYAVPAWLAQHGATPTEIATFITISTLPWAFKILIAPLLDRYTYLPMGRKRPWIIFGQVGLMLSFVAFGLLPDPLNNLFWLNMLTFVLSVFGCFQDVGTDGMAVDLIPPAEQSRANGLMWGGKVVGMSATLAVSAHLMDALGFWAGSIFPALVVGVVIFVPLLLRERPGERLLPWTAGKPSPTARQLQVKSVGEVMRDLRRAMLLPSSLALVVGLCCAGVMQGVFETMMPIIAVQELGWTDVTYSELYAAVGLTMGVAGMWLGGKLAARFRQRDLLMGYAAALALAGFVAPLLRDYWHHTAFVVGVLVYVSAVGTFAMIVLLAFGMQHSWRRVAATQFTLYMALSNVGLVLGSSLTGFVQPRYGWEALFVCYGALGLLMATSVSVICLRKHRAQMQALDAPAVAAA